MISKELLSEVLDLKYPIRIIHHFCKGQNVLNYDLHVECALFQESINIHELAHKNLKEWAKLKNVFDIIDWSEEPEQIFKKAEEFKHEEKYTRVHKRA